MFCSVALTLTLLARGTKRKFAFDSSTVEHLAQEAEEAALVQIEREQVEALRAKLPDFWLPSLTPTYTSSGPPRSLKDVKLQTTCRGGNPAHPIAQVFFQHTQNTVLTHFCSLKNLVNVRFTLHTSSAPSRSADSTPAQDASKDKSDDRHDPMCPSCKKDLHNNVIMYRAYLNSLNLAI